MSGLTLSWLASDADALDQSGMAKTAVEVARWKAVDGAEDWRTGTPGLVTWRDAEAEEEETSGSVDEPAPADLEAKTVRKTAKIRPTQATRPATTFD